MMRYLLAFFVGWIFNSALDVNQVTHATLRWLQAGSFAPFVDWHEPPRKR